MNYSRLGRGPRPTGRPHGSVVPRRITSGAARSLADPVMRTLALLTAVTSAGDGLFMTLGVLYFTRIVGIPFAQVGLGLTVAGGVGVAANVPLGRLADRFGARPVMVTMLCAQSLAAGGYVLADSFASFLVCACFAVPLQRTAKAVSATLYAELLSAECLTLARSYLRAVTNAGVGLGAAAAGVVLTLDTRASYVTAIMVDAATFAIAAIVLARLRRSSHHHPNRTKHRPGVVRLAARDRRYILVTALNGILFLQYGLLEVGLPGWVVTHTKAPRATVAILLLLNTVLCLALQVRSARRIHDLRTAGRAARLGGTFLAVGCMLYALAAHGGRWQAMGVLIAGMIFQSAAELATSTAGWIMSYDLADPKAPGLYQGIFNTGSSLATMSAPLLVAATALGAGILGWLMLAVLFLVAGLVLAPLSRPRPAG